MLNNVVIYTRFSIVNNHITRAWKGARMSPDLENWINRMNDPERLAVRERIFIDFSLPLLSQAVADYADLNLIHIVHASSHLPDETKKKLLDASQKYSFMKLAFITPEQVYSAEDYIARELSNCYLGDGSVAALMRLDDDDLISPSYFPILKKYMKPEFSGMIFHTPRGFEGLFVRDSFSAFTPMDAAKTGIGLAYLASFDSAKRVLTSKYVLPPGPHLDCDKYAPLILDGSEPVIFRTKHLFNDARATKEGYSFSDEKLLTEKFFREVASADEVFKYFPTLK